MSEILNIYTTYSAIKFVLLVILLTLPLSIFFYIKTHTKKLLLFILSSQLISVGLFLLIAYFGNRYFATVVDGFNQIGLFMVILLNNMNLSKYGSDMIIELNRKDPDPDRINRNHFKISTNMGITILLLGLAIGLFIPQENGQVVLSITITMLLILTANHFTVRKIFFDARDRKGQ